MSVDDEVKRRYEEYVAGLRAQQEREWLDKFNLLRNAPPEVQQAELDRYNKLAAQTQAANGGKATLEPDDLGRTFVQYPKLSLAGQNPNRIIGPMPLPPQPNVRIQYAPAAAGRPDVRQHEELHKTRALPQEQPGTPLGNEYEKLGQRDRTLWAAQKALLNDSENGAHAFHVDELDARLAVMGELRKKLIKESQDAQLERSRQAIRNWSFMK